jgi:polysaccharide export outer membrane protein
MISALIKKAGFLVFCCLVVLNPAARSFAEDVPNKDYVIGAEDVLDIQVWGNDDLHRSVEVSREGAFTFPLIGKVKAAGLSVFELEKHMRERLADGYLIDPHVTVTVSTYKSQKVFVLGEVKKPGSYVIKGRTDILKIISEAEGLTEEAGRTVTVTRQKPSQKDGSPKTSGQGKDDTATVVDLDQMQAGSPDDNYYVFNGDSVFVSKAPRIYVTGEVIKPGAFKWEKGLTVHQAVSLAGGPTSKGAVERSRIVRTVNGHEKEIKPGLNDLVMPDDIVKVPQSYF